jgi:AcrR family transcriptional regulator
MPRVSQKHLDRRRRQILDAASRCFAAEGFHATSMQDVLAASELSAGAVYRYFPSKQAIIEAIADETFTHILSVLTEALNRKDPPRPTDVLGDLITAMAGLDDAKLRIRIVIQVWGEAIRNPEVRDVIMTRLTAVYDVLTQVVIRAQKAGLMDTSVPPRIAAETYIGILPGLMVQKAIFGDDFDLPAHVSALRTLFAS